MTTSRPHARIVRDTRGASFVLALALVMICAVVSALIVGAASTNAERGHQRTQEERAYYAVASAVDQGSALYQAYAPAVRMRLSSLNTGNIVYTTSATGKQESWREELETWTALAATGQTKAPLVFTARAVSDALGQDDGGASPAVEISYQMNPSTYEVTVTASQADSTIGYANTLKHTIKKDASHSSETATERAVSWNSTTAPPLKKHSSSNARAPKTGKVSKKLARVYAAWQSDDFDWGSISWKQLKDERGVSYLAVQEKKAKLVCLVWYGGHYYKATFNGADHSTPIEGFDVRDHLLQGHPFYNGDGSTAEPVSIVWQEVSAP